MKLKNWLRLFFYGTALFLGAWAFWLEPASLRVTEYELPLSQWPADQAGLRVAVLTDIHAGAPYIGLEKLRKIVAMTQAAKPDLILLSGDYVINNVLGGRPLPNSEIAAALSALQAPLGVYAVLGNHEHRLDAGGVREAFKAHGISLIDNRMLRIASGRHQFWLWGLGEELDDPPNIQKDLLQVTDEQPIIALAHNPWIFRKLPARVNLVIAGHTHGGQVNLPFLGPWMLQQVHPPIIHGAGHYREHTDLFVATGIGTSNLPVRFRVPPEISILTLRPEHE